VKPQTRIFVVPQVVDGRLLRVVWPAGSAKANKPLPAEGASVPYDHYWSNRLKDGSVKLAEPPAPNTPKASKAKG